MSWVQAIACSWDGPRAARSPTRCASRAVIWWRSRNASCEPRELRQVRLDPSGAAVRAGQGRRAIEAGEQPLVEKRGVAPGECLEIVRAVMRDVMCY